MKKIICLLSFAVTLLNAAFAQIPISQARVSNLGTSVTVTGIVTNGSELGNIRYLQDATGGIAAYGATMAPIMRGDEITVTGTLTNFNSLLEMSPVTSVVINSSGNTLPVAEVIDASQMDEPHEAHLVQINNVLFANGGQTFIAGTNYNFTANGLTGQIRINAGSNIVGTIIPSAAVNVQGIVSQYFATYQLLPRDLVDISTPSVFFITIQPTQNNITNTGFDINWTTNLASTSYIEYGHTPALELGILNGTSGSVNHTVTISGAGASEIFYVKAYSVSGADTAHSIVKIYMTGSNSSGIIKCYFNRPVDNSVATVTNATQLINAIDDTLSAYLSRAKHSIDIAIYNFDQTNLSDIAGAINTVNNNGVQVRLIYNSTTSNPSLSLLNPGINTLASPTGVQYGIMHNKFVVIDADSPDANEAFVWTGSTNWNDQQINTDANNVIIFQDQSLARAYKMEFEEMWGSTTTIPNAGNAKFGPDKADNTPHQFSIGGKLVEIYFSPSDNTNQQIINTVSTANTDISFEVMAFTRTDIAQEIVNRANAGVFAIAGMMNDSANGAGVVFNMIAAMAGTGMMLYNHSINPGILHHKLVIVDQASTWTDPLVLTGSHNWSSAAQQKNDENTVIVHDASIANQYYQEFYKRFTTNGGVLGVGETASPLMNYAIYPVPNNGIFTLQYQLKETVNGKILIQDATGKIIAEKIVFGKQGLNVLSVADLKLTSGIYFATMKFGNSSTSNKFIVKP